MYTYQKNERKKYGVKTLAHDLRVKNGRERTLLCCVPAKAYRKTFSGLAPPFNR